MKFLKALRDEKTLAHVGDPFFPQCLFLDTWPSPVFTRLPRMHRAHYPFYVGVYIVEAWGSDILVFYWKNSPIFFLALNKRRQLWNVLFDSLGTTPNLSH